MSSIEPFLFGDNSRLFGIYHPAVTQKKGHSVVVASPLLNEYMRSHLALRQISGELARSGFDVLRFDYFGTGNSSGNISDATLQMWSENVTEAATELYEITGNNKTSIIAARFGANLAADFSNTHAVQKFLMWDPILCGQTWLRSLQRSQAQLIRKFGVGVIDESREFSGHRLCAPFSNELSERAAPVIRSAEQFAVITESFEESDFLVESDISYEVVEFSCGWEDLTSQVLYPHEVVDRLCQAMK